MKLQWIEAGEVVNTHGVRGQMRVMPWGDSPEFLCEFKRVQICGVEYKVESCKVQNTCNLLKLEGVDSIEQAQLLRGKTVEVYREDAAPGLVFAAELMGMKVVCDGKTVGEITDVLDYPGNKVYTVQGEHEYMIPAVKEFILGMDLEKNEMQVRMIEGMRSDED